MNFLRKLLGGKETDPVTALLTALNDKNKSVRLQAVSDLEKIGAPRALGPLLCAIRDEDQEVRSSALAHLVSMGLDETDAKRIKIYYHKENSWKKGLAAWRKGIELITTTMNLPAQIAGLDPISIFGDMNRGIVGFLFDDEQKTIETALKTKMGVSVLIWSGRSMSQYEFGSDTKEACKVAEDMKNQGATAFVAVNCSPQMERSLSPILKTETGIG